MKDRSTLGARRAPALIATVVVLAGGADLARAAEPSPDNPDASADVSPVQAQPGPAPAPMAAPAPAAAANPAAPPEPPTVPAPVPVPAPTVPVPALPPGDTTPDELTGAAWFARPRLVLSVGQPGRAFALRFFGFLQADFMADTTRSYDDTMGASLVARTNTYENHHGRTQFSLRSTRLGFGFESPSIGPVTPSAVIESDFAGSQASPPGSTEAVYFASPLFRIRHAYAMLKSPYLDLLFGHTSDVFGWQSYFDPSGLRNQLFSRNPQLRISRELNPEGVVTFELAAAAVRPAQRDSGVPDVSAGLRVSFNGWQGIRTPGNERIVAMPLTLAVSGIARQFKANAWKQPPIQSANSVTGWGISLDAFLPIIPATNFVDRGNRLALMGSFVKGSGIADLIGVTGGAKFPTLFNPAMTYPPPEYVANTDDGLVTFDGRGVLHTIDWTAFRVGLQYYLPTTGRWIFSANYTQAHSANMAALYPQGGKEVDLQTYVADTLRYADAKLTFDVTPVLRVGVYGQYTQTVYVDAVYDNPHNFRIAGQSIYLF